MIGNSNTQVGIKGDTLEKAFGKTFEKNVLWLTLHDQDFAQQTIGHLTSDQFEHLPYQTLITTFRNINEAHGGKHLATLDTIQADLTARYNAAKEGSPSRETAAAALRSCKNLRKRKSMLSADREYTFSNVRRFVAIRNTREALIKSADLLAAGKIDDIPEIVSTAVMTGSLKPNIGIKYANVRKRLKMYTQNQQHRIRSSTDLPLIDGVMAGGLPSKTLGVFVAPQGRGKTMAMVHVGAAALIQGLTVVHCSLEIAEVDIALRYDARLTGLPISRITQDPDHFTDVLLRTAHDMEGKLYIKEWGSNEASTWDIRAYLKTLEQHEHVKPDVLLVDYAALLRPTRNRKEMRFELGDIARELRQLSKDYECAVWTASQTNKEGQKSDLPEIQHAAETSELMNVADVVFSFGQTLEEKRRERLRWAIVKNRVGGCVGRVVDCIVKEDTQLFTQAKRQSQAVEDLNKSRKRHHGSE